MVKSQIYALAAMQTLNIYSSPHKEKSMWTGLRIEDLDFVRSFLHSHLPEQYNYRIRFQRPGFGLHKISTNKVNAVSFTVYVSDRKPRRAPMRTTPIVIGPPEFIWNNGYKYQLCVL